MANENKGLGLIETKGQFQVRGIVSGTEKDNFFKQITTKSDKQMRMINFGVEFKPDAKMYVGFNGMEQDYVYFSKQVKDENGKTKNETEKVPWKDRFTFKKEGFRPIGVNVGVVKKTDDKGNEVNDKKVLHQYDACKEIGDNLVDDVSVFIKGNITYSTYEGKHQTRFEPNQISLCKPVDFEDESFAPMANFQQKIIFMGITPNEDKTKFMVEAKIVTYNTIEDAEFVILDSKLAALFKKNLKPYMSIEVWGDINVEKNEEEVSEDDGWGEKNQMKRTNSPDIRELVIKGADPKSIDKEVYSQENLDAAIEKLKNNKKAKEEYNGGESSDGWGSVSQLTEGEDDEDDPW